MTTPVAPSAQTHDGGASGEHAPGAVVAAVRAGRRCAIRPCGRPGREARLADHASPEPPYRTHTAPTFTTTPLRTTRPAGAAGAAKAHGLTPREVAVLRLLAEGRSDKEIAGALCVAYRTATSHVTSLLTKLGLPSRAAAAYAVRRGLA